MAAAIHQDKSWLLLLDYIERMSLLGFDKYDFRLAITEPYVLGARLGLCNIHSLQLKEY